MELDIHEEFDRFNNEISNYIADIFPDLPESNVKCIAARITLIHTIYDKRLVDHILSVVKKEG